MVKPTSVRETRQNLADLLGEAYYRNELFRIERKDKPVAYVTGAPTMERLAELFKPSIQVEEDDGCWLARCPPLDLATELPNRDEAIDDLLDAIVEYSERFMRDFERYANSPNRAGHLPYVLAVQLQQDKDSLRNWLGL